MTQAYPLAWPPGRPRRSPTARKAGPFSKSVQREGGWRSKSDLTIMDSVKRLQSELDRLGARLPVISCNVEPRLDGLPRSDRAQPADPGVAVYFQLKGKPHCLPCDSYTTVAQNIAAIAAHIEATRAVERHGVASASEMFAGFAALPSPEPVKRSWWAVLGIPSDAPGWMIEAAYKEHAKTMHPDRGGTREQFQELQEAIEAARLARRSLARRS